MRMAGAAPALDQGGGLNRGEHFHRCPGVAIIPLPDTALVQAGAGHIGMGVPPLTSIADRPHVPFQEPYLVRDEQK